MANIKIIIAPSGKLNRSRKNDEEIAMIKVKIHVNKLVVIYPKEDIVNDDDTGHGWVC